MKIGKKILMTGLVGLLTFNNLNGKSEKKDYDSSKNLKEDYSNLQDSSEYKILRIEGSIYKINFNNSNIDYDDFFTKSFKKSNGNNIWKWDVNGVKIKKLVSTSEYSPNVPIEFLFLSYGFSEFENEEPDIYFDFDFKDSTFVQLVSISSQKDLPEKLNYLIDNQIIKKNVIKKTGLKEILKNE